MKPRDCFGIVVRSAGLIALGGDALYVYSVIIVMMNPERPNTAPATHYFVAACIWLIAGLYLVRGAPLLMRFSYGNDPQEQEPESLCTAPNGPKQDGPRCVSCDAPIGVGAKLCSKCGWANP